MSAGRITPIFHGEIRDGKIILERREDFHARIVSLEGKRVELLLRRHRVRRSGGANRYYWGVVVALIAEHCGYTAEEAHEALKWRFLQKHDGPIPTVRSTSGLDIAEFAEYVESCRRMGAELGVIIPGPGQVE